MLFHDKKINLFERLFWLTRKFSLSSVVAHSVKYDKHDKHDKHDKVDKYDKHDKVDKHDKHDKVDKHDKHDKVDKHDKHDKVDKHDKHDKVDKHDKHDKVVLSESKSVSIQCKNIVSQICAIRTLSRLVNLVPSWNWALVTKRYNEYSLLKLALAGALPHAPTEYVKSY